MLRLCCISSTPRNSWNICCISGKADDKRHGIAITFVRGHSIQSWLPFVTAAADDAATTLRSTVAEAAGGAPLLAGAAAPAAEGAAVAPAGGCAAAASGPLSCSAAAAAASEALLLPAAAFLRALLARFRAALSAVRCCAADACSSSYRWGPH